MVASRCMQNAKCLQSFVVAFQKSFIIESIVVLLLGQFGAIDSGTEL
jgi:hypothetical protein